MAARKVKGQKLSLNDFVGAASERDALPSGPSGFVEEERPRGGRWGAERGERSNERGGDRAERGERGSRFGGEEGEEEGPSRADEADRWRSRAAAPARSERPDRSFDRERSGGFDRERSGGDRSFDRERSGGFDRERTTERSERGGFDRERSGGFDRDGPVRRAGGFEREERRGGFEREPRAERGEAGEREPARSEETSDWRGSKSAAAPAGDKDAEWRRHRSAARGDREESSESGERRGFGFGRSERSGERYEPRGAGTDREARPDRYEPRGDRSENRGGDRFGDRAERSDRFESRRGGDRDEPRGERSFGGGYGARREREEAAPAERPAHLKNLLKPGAEAPADAAQPTETATERMERLSLEREQRAKPTETAPRASPVDDLKQPELAPIKLSTTRRAPAATEARLEPARATPSNSVLRQRKEAATPAPAPAPVPIVMDESRYDANVLKSVVVAGSKKQNPIELALQDKQTTIKDGDLDALKTMNLSSQTAEIAAVLARSISAKTLHLSNFAQSITSLNTDDARNLFAATLSAIYERKGEAELLSFIDSSSVNALSILVPSNDAAEIDRVLAQHSLNVLKPVRDLSADVKTKLSSANSAEIVTFIDTELGSKSAAVSPVVAKMVATHVFDLVFANAKTPDYSVISTWSAALKRVSNDVNTKLSVCFAAQAVWFKATAAPKGAFKEIFIALEKAGIMQTEDFAAWRDDLKDKTPGKPKALLQVGAWIKLAEEEAKKRMPKAAKQQESEDEDDEDEDDEENEDDEDEYDPSYPARR